MIELKNITKTFHTSEKDIVALNDVSLTVNDGEIFGIIGLSGAGKSTLVRCINLLERPDSGQVLIDGRDLLQMKEKDLLATRRNIGMIFQGFCLLEQRTVMGNVCYPLEISGVKRAEAKKRAAELLELVGLGNRASSYPSQLSGGQKQRVAIARALATKPKYLLCDEATSALDPTTTASILSLLQEINRTLGVTIVVITHEMDVIDRICSRVAVLDKSRIMEMGAVSDIFTNPQSDIAKELILPAAHPVDSLRSETKLRIVFNGESSFLPVVSNLIMECHIPVNILFADTKDIDGKAYGQILLGVPDDERSVERAAAWLNAHGIHFNKEV